MKRFDHLNNLLAQIKAEMGSDAKPPTMEMPVIRILPPLAESPADAERRGRIYEEHRCGLDG